VLLNFIFILIYFVLTVLLHIYDMTRYYCIFFVEYPSEDGREKPKRVGGLPHVCTPLYLIAVQVCVCVYIYIYTSRTAWNVDNLNKTRSVVSLFPVTIQ